MSGTLKIAAALIRHIIDKSAITSSQSWINWRETVLLVFEKQMQTGKINAQINAGKIVSAKFKTKKTVDDTISEIQESDKTEIISLIELYKVIYHHSDDFVPDAFNYKLFDEIVNSISNINEVRKIAQENAEKWFLSKTENKFYTYVYVPAVFKLIVLDFILRVFVLKFYQIAEFTLGDFDFWLLQILAIPLLVFIYAFFRDKKIIGYTQSLIAKIKVENIRFKIRNTAWHYLLLFILVLLGIVVNYIVEDFELGAIGAFILGIAHAIYLLVLQTNFSKQQPSYHEIKRQLEEKEHREIAGELSPELNDEEIIAMEVSLKSENERMNAYIIEAALFGALAFSGYLGLAVSDSFSTGNIAEFNSHIFNILKNLIDKPVANIAVSYQFLLSKNGILIMLSYFSLFCSVFFLAVIASRLHFSRLIDLIDKALQLSKGMNEKEESILQNDKTNIRELNHYNNKIKIFLREGFKKQDELAPILEYMQFFRTLGIVTFFVIIIIGGLFISVGTSLMLLFISTLSMFYFYTGKTKTYLKILYISMQEFYYRIDTKIQIVCWSMIFIALFMRTFSITGGGQIMMMGFSFLFIHSLLSLFIPVQFDYEVKKSEDVFGSSMRFNKLLAVIFKLSMAFLYLGYMFKIMHWPGSGIFLIGSFMMMCFYFLLVRKMKNEFMKIEYLISIVIVLVLAGTLFKIMHWPGAFIGTFFGIPLIYPTAVYLFLKRKLVRPLILRTVFVLCFFSIGAFSPFARSAIMNLSFNYSDYEFRQKATVLTASFYIKDKKMISIKTVGEDSVRNVLERFNKAFVNIEKPDCDFLNRQAWNVVLYADDSLIFANALKWSEITVKTDGNNAEWLDTYAWLLYKNKQFTQAKIFAEKAIRIDSYMETGKLIIKIDSVLRK